MKQLAKLAQAIVHGPQLIILDEPTNGLDPPTRKRMIDLIRDGRTGDYIGIAMGHPIVLPPRRANPYVIAADGAHA